MKSLQNPLSLAGRVLLALLFIPAGFAKLGGFAGTVAYIGSVGLPAPSLAAAFALTLEIIGGSALLLGFQTRAVAIALALFTLIASVFFHSFWAVPEAQAFVQQLLFFKNVAVAGGLLSVAAWGAGPWSIDALRGHQVRAAIA